MKQYMAKAIALAAHLVSRTGYLFLPVRVIALVSIWTAATASWANPAPDLNPGSTDWQLVESFDNIQLFTKEIPGSGVEAFKAEAIIDASPASIFAVIANPHSCAQWVDGCIESKAMGGISFNNRTGYALNRLPWPFRNRQVVVNITQQLAQYDQGIRIEIVMATSQEAALPDTSKAVTIKRSYSRYIIESMGRFDALDTPETANDYENRNLEISPLNTPPSKLTWLQHTEPAGSLPDWLVNQKVTELPSLSIPRLGELAKSSPYAGAKLVLDRKGNLIDIKMADNSLVSRHYQQNLDSAKDNSSLNRPEAKSP